MLPSIDTYLYDQIKTKLQIILENRYIIEEILKGIQPDIASSFIRTYTGRRAKEIPIVYKMPQTKELQQAAIYIGLREGEESKPSIGNLEGIYEFKENGFLSENVSIQADTDKTTCYFELENPAISLNNVEGLSFSVADNVRIKNNRIYFSYDAELVGLTFKVNYYPDNGDEVGTKQGFTATEAYSILVISTNMDTVRCLDLIIKAVLILMRSNPEELTNMLLQRLQFGQIEEIPVGTDAVPEILYGRESIVTYTTSYNLDAPILTEVLKELRLKINFDTD